VDRDPAAPLAGLADHALPRQPIARLARLHRGARDARATGDAGELGDLTVGRDPAHRDPPDHDMDPPEQRLEVVGIAGRHRGSHATTTS
jgi:hypothetical protein